MQIYIFTIDNVNEEDISICQVYAKSKIRALMYLMLATGCNEDDLTYCGNEETTKPLEWERNFKETKTYLQ